jgi:hypothetical protein
MHMFTEGRQAQINPRLNSAFLLPELVNRKTKDFTESVAHPAKTSCIK